MERYTNTDDWATGIAPLPTVPGDAPGPVAPPIQCGLCSSLHVLVIGLAWNMDYHTGEAHYGYEVRCEECHRFSAFAHAEAGRECDALLTRARLAQAQQRATRQTLLGRITARLSAHGIY